MNQKQGTHSFGTTRAVMKILIEGCINQTSHITYFTALTINHNLTQ